MVNFRSSVLEALFLMSSLLTFASAEVTCTEQTVHAFANPSFETGDLTGWTSMRASGVASPGVVVAGDSIDGDYHFTIPASATWTYLKQTLSNLDTSKTYDLSFDYRLTTDRAGIPSQYCFVAWSRDSWSSFISPRPQIRPSPSTAQWTSLPLKWQPTSSTHDLYINFACTYTGVTIDIDNVQLPISTTSVCTTSAPTSDAATGSSVVATSPAATSESLTSSSVVVSQPPVSPSAVATPSASTSESVTSSNVVGSQTPSTVPVHISPSFTSSATVAISSTVVHTSPSSIAYTVSSSVHASSPVAPVLSSSSIAVSQPSSIHTFPSIHSSAFASSSAHTSSASSSFVHSSSAGSPSQSTGSSQAVQPSGVPHHSGSPSASGPSLLNETLPNGSHPVVTGAPPAVTNGPSIPKATTTPAPLTTSTVMTTRTSTITACPSSVVHCPAASKTTFVTTETVVLSTTVCPATETAEPIQATQVTSSIFSTRTATITACPDHQLYCALPQRKTQLVTETLLVSTTVYLAAVPTSNRRPIYIDTNGMHGLPPKPTQIGWASTSTYVGGSESTEELAYIPGGAEVTRTQVIFSTIFVTQTTLATACPTAATGSSSAYPQPHSSSVRAVYF